MLYNILNDEKSVYDPQHVYIHDASQSFPQWTLTLKCWEMPSERNSEENYCPCCMTITICLTNHFARNTIWQLGSLFFFNGRGSVIPKHHAMFIWSSFLKVVDRRRRYPSFARGAASTDTCLSANCTLLCSPVCTSSANSASNCSSTNSASDSPAKDLVSLFLCLLTSPGSPLELLNISKRFLHFEAPSNIFHYFR